MFFHVTSEAELFYRHNRIPSTGPTHFGGFRCLCGLSPTHRLFCWAIYLTERIETLQNVEADHMAKLLPRPGDGEKQEQLMWQKMVDLMMTVLSGPL